MKKIRLDLRERGYDIIIGSGAVKALVSIVKKSGFKGPVIVISDTIVASKTSTVMRPVLSSIKNDVHRIEVPASERSKSIEIFQRTAHKISKLTRSHRPFIVALGGGVVGDLAGFVAATYRRGVPYMQMPTTLLAQVDSSIGGKVGIDLPQAKNMIGAFYQPKAVICDTDLLRTLPQRQVRNGLAEVIKYAVIQKGWLFKFLEDNIKDVLALDPEAMERVISECAAIKAWVVENDEHDDKDIRIALNFGHTLGHAIESATEYSGAYNHGESVAIGMLLAGEIAMRLDMFPEKDFFRLKNLIKKAGLPLMVAGDVPIRKILDSHCYDKKFSSGVNRFVLPTGIGNVEVIDDIPELLIKTVLKEYIA
jgi:3-dehydroquinate synthase